MIAMPTEIPPDTMKSSMVAYNELRAETSKVPTPHHVQSSHLGVAVLIPLPSSSTRPSSSTSAISLMSRPSACRHPESSAMCPLTSCPYLQRAAKHRTHQPRDPYHLIPRITSLHDHHPLRPPYISQRPLASHHAVLALVNTVLSCPSNI
jgi:hypothetical protein